MSNNIEQEDTLYILVETEWVDKYKPMKNHLNPDASWTSEKGEGIMFETYGIELDFINSVDYHRVWTYIEGDYQSDALITNGRHLINRLGYFISEFPWLDGQTIEIELDTSK